MKINIREKIASLKAFGDTFEHQETRGEKQIVHLLSVFNDSDSRYFVDYLQYYIRTENGAEHCYFKEIATHTDRLYFLELVNSLIDSARRVELFATLIGRREFGQGDAPLVCYPLEGGCNIEQLAECFAAGRRSLRGDKTRHVISKRMGKNVNVYEAFCFEEAGSRYVWLDQKNISNFQRREKSFLIELTQEQSDRFHALLSHTAKIDFCFQCIGMRVIERVPYAQARTLEGRITPESLSENFLERISAHELFDKLGDLEGSPLLKERDRLYDEYLDLYAVAVKIITESDNAGRTKSAAELADRMSAYGSLLGQEGAFYLLSALLLKIAAHLREKVVCEEILADINNAEVLVDALAYLENWIEALFSLERHRIAYATIDLINDFTYVEGLLALRGCEL
ncbi:MAG: hypothetical protein AB7E49_07290 [Campylobacterales bacterium]